jgi:hypothetical protein
MTLIPDSYDFTVWRGASFYESLVVYTDSGTTPRDLSTCSISMVIRRKPKGDILYTLNTSNGKIIITNATGGAFNLTINNTDTDGFKWKSGYYDIIITDSGNNVVDAILHGNVMVKE